MADIQVSVIDFKGIEDQVSGGKAVIRYGKVIFRNVPCLCRRRVGAAMLQIYSQLAVYPVGKGTAVEVTFLIIHQEQCDGCGDNGSNGGDAQDLAIDILHDGFRFGPHIRCEHLVGLQDKKVGKGCPPRMMFW